jgi:hypothetical protein
MSVENSVVIIPACGAFVIVTVVWLVWLRMRGQ